MSDSTDVTRPDPRTPAEVRKRSVEGEDGQDIARILTCGDLGGRAKRKITQEVDDDPENTFDEIIEVPCEKPSGFGIPGSQWGITPSKCYVHTDERIENTARQKARFLEVYVQNPELGITAAAEKVGYKSRANIYWWMDHDPEFRENMKAIAVIAEAILTDQVEEMVVQAIREWRPGAGVLAQWYLANRRGWKWKPMGKASDAPSGVEFSGGKHVHVWKMDHKLLPFDD